VKFDKLSATTSGQPIFTRDEETAVEIRATFVIDLSQLRSFGHGGKGLSDAQKAFLLRLALWKIGKLVGSPFRYRSGCDLELFKLTEGRGETKAEVDPASLCAINAAAITTAAFRAGDDKRPVVTQVYWKAGELFKEGKADAPAPTDGDGASTEGE
jgi:CRISPR-associated protein Csb1